MSEGFGMMGTSVSKIVNPDVLINAIDRKFKAWITQFQAVEFARALALQKYYSNRKIPVVRTFINEHLDLSGSINGRNVEGYIKVGSVRVAVNDRKRTLEMDNSNVV